jgi:hypothetical protein
VAASKWWMAWAQLSSQSMGVLRFGPTDGAMTLPSGPITGSRSGRETLLMSVAVAPGGGSIGPLRPHPARPPISATISGACGDNMTKPRATYRSATTEVVA